MLFVGGLASFAGVSSPNTSATPDFDPDFCFLSLVLYALGTVVSLIGTGFLIGVRLISLLARKGALTSWKTQSKQFSKQLKLVSGNPATHNI